MPAVSCIVNYGQFFASDCKAALQGSDDRDLNVWVFYRTSSTLIRAVDLPLCKSSESQAGMMVSAVVYQIKAKIYKLHVKTRKPEQDRTTEKVHFNLK